LTAKNRKTAMKATVATCRNVNTVGIQ
jgi:hypothetical protein